MDIDAATFQNKTHTNFIIQFLILDLPLKHLLKQSLLSSTPNLCGASKL